MITVDAGGNASAWGLFDATHFGPSNHRDDISPILDINIDLTNMMQRNTNRDHARLQKEKPFLYALRC